MSRQRRYAVYAEGPEGSFYGGIIQANTKRSAIRPARIKFHLESLRIPFPRTANDYHWRAEFVPSRGEP